MSQESQVQSAQDRLAEVIDSAYLSSFAVRVGKLISRRTKAERERHAETLLELIEAVEARAHENAVDALIERQAA